MFSFSNRLQICLLIYQETVGEPVMDCFCGSCIGSLLFVLGINASFPSEFVGSWWKALCGGPLSPWHASTKLYRCCHKPKAAIIAQGQPYFCIDSSGKVYTCPSNFIKFGLACLHSCANWRKTVCWLRPCHWKRYWFAISDLLIFLVGLWIPNG